jgi:hypothetical protein
VGNGGSSRAESGNTTHLSLFPGMGLNAFLSTAPAFLLSTEADRRCRRREEPGTASGRDAAVGAPPEGVAAAAASASATLRRVRGMVGISAGTPVSAKLVHTRDKLGCKTTPFARSGEAGGAALEAAAGARRRVVQRGGLRTGYGAVGLRPVTTSLGSRQARYSS